MEIRKLDQSELKQLHNIQILILNEIDRICRKHDIKYMISGGTLLGAIRHKGFIPWDDDIDVRMDRAEYNKFCDICVQELDEEHFFFQTYKTDENYPWFFSKMRYNNTRFVRVGQEHLTMHDGIFVDIFPSDGLPNSTIARDLVLIQCYFLKKILYSKVGCISEKNIIKKQFYKLVNKIPKKLVYDSFEKLSQKYIGREYKYIADYSFPPYPSFLRKKEYYKRDWLYDLIEVSFEKKEYYTTSYYEKWLTLTYDNYMELPPIENRVGNNDVTIFELNLKNN